MLRALRLAAGLTQEALAERAGVSSRAVSDLERDPRRAPRLDTVTLLSDALELSPAQRAGLLAAARPAEPEPIAGRQPVPRPLTPLIGRAGVAAALVELLERGETQLLTLTGPGGVGKTRLAVEVLARVTDHFARGSVFIDLAPLRDHNLVVAAVAHQFGLDERASAPVSERLAAALREKHVLVLLDNFEHLLDARTDLVELLTACPGVTALVTSRVPLRVRGEREHRIAPLEVPRLGTGELGDSAAESLLEERARAVGVELTTSERPAVAEICRRLEGLPLAIELAAARTRLFRPDALLDRLDQRLPMLVSGPHDLPDRQKTMRDAIDWSYQLLSEPAKVLFRTLSVFAGGCPLPAAESLSGDPDFVDTLAELVDASLVAVRHAAPAPRIAMLETIREYGLERQQAAGEAAHVARRHADYFVALAERDPAGAAEADQDNLRAALGWALDEEDAATALRLCAALGRFWLERGGLAEGLRFVRSALALPPGPDVPTAARLAALTSAVRLAIAVSCDDEAGVWAEELVELARRQGTVTELVIALNARGLVARTQDRYADAARDHEEAIVLAEQGTDRAGYAAALIGLSYATFFTGEFAKAEELAERGLAATRESGDHRGLADALLLLAWQATHAGRYELAHRLGTEGVELLRPLKHSGKIAEGLRFLGANAQLSGQYELAGAFLEEARVLFTERGEHQVADQLLAHLAHVAMCTGELSRAHRLASEALSSARRFNDQWAVAMSATTLGHVELAVGGIDAARRLFAESAEVFQVIGNPLYLGWCLEGLASIAVADERWQVAAELCAAREAVLADMGAVLPPMHPADHDHTLAMIDSVLGEAGVAAARQSAQQTPLPALVAAAQDTSAHGQNAANGP